MDGVIDEKSVARFWSKVDMSGGPDSCWPWKASVVPTTGYGQFWFNGTQRGAHRMAYLIANGQDAINQVGHSCHDADPACPSGWHCPHRTCCNPAHLVDQTPAENQRSKRNRCRRAKHPWITEGVDFVVYDNGKVHTCLHCRAENAERVAVEGQPHRVTECKRGHDMGDPANAYVAPDGRRQCRACARIRNGNRATMSRSEAGRLGALARWGK